MKAFKYTNREDSFITVTKIEEPYGPDTASVVSVGCTLKGDLDNPSWKVHIPADLAHQVAREIIHLVKYEKRHKYGEFFLYSGINENQDKES